MASNDKKTNIYDKVLITKEKFSDYLIEFLDSKINDLAQSSFISSGVLDDDTIGLGAGTAANEISLDITNASRGVDNAGHIMDLSLLASTTYEDIDFENANGVDYYVLNLSKPEFYNHPVVNFGYARGYEPYNYVKDIFDRYKNYKTITSQ